MNLNGADVCKIDGGECTGTLLTSYNEIDLDVCDTLYVDYTEKLSNLSLYQDAIIMAEKMGKEVILSRELSRKLNLTKESHSNISENSSDFGYLAEIGVPVITILSQGVHTGQFAVELALRKSFSEKGYKVSQIGTQKSSKFFGISEFPDFIYENEDVCKKMVRFNHFSNSLIEKESPDLLIMGVPEPILKYNDKILNGLGVTPFVVCNAVRSDLAILCVYYSEYKNSDFNEMCQNGNYRLDAPIHFFNIANAALEPNTSSGTIKMQYIDLSSDFVLNNIKEITEIDEYCLFNVLNTNSFEKAYDAIERKLTDNVQSI